MGRAAAGARLDRRPARLGHNEVLEDARKTGADLIVVGSHRPTIATYLLGSNASTIVRHAELSPCRAVVGDAPFQGVPVPD